MTQGLVSLFRSEGEKKCKLSGKKTERVLLRVSEEMAKQIRELADTEHRTICDQIRHLIATALSQKAAKESKATVG